MNAAINLQQAVIAHLSAHPALAELTGVYEGPPPRAAFPYAVIGDGLVSDWSTKTEPGREVRFAINVWDDGEEPARLHRLTAGVETAMATLPNTLPHGRIISLVLVRAMIVRDSSGPWAGLVEHRIRILQDQEN